MNALSQPQFHHTRDCICFGCRTARNSRPDKKPAAWYRSDLAKPARPTHTRLSCNASGKAQRRVSHKVYDDTNKTLCGYGAAKWDRTDDAAIVDCAYCRILIEKRKAQRGK